MTEEEIYHQFNGNCTNRGTEHYVHNDSAIDFVEYILSKKIRILGIEGFNLNQYSITPNINVISDYSEKQPMKEVVLSFLKNNDENVSHFNFILDV